MEPIIVVVITLARRLLQILRRFLPPTRKLKQLKYKPTTINRQYLTFTTTTNAVPTPIPTITAKQLFKQQLEKNVIGLIIIIYSPTPNL